MPLLAVVAAMLVVWLLNSMTMLSGSPVGPIGVQKQEHPNQISFVECPRFMALCNGRRREGSVKGARSVRVHRSAAETLDGFFRLCQARCLKRGHSTKKEIWSIFLIAVRSCARKGRLFRALPSHWDDGWRKVRRSPHWL